MENEIITSDSDLRQFIKDGHFFNFCIAFALNKGFRNAIKEKTEVSFSVGDYEVKFDNKQMCFTIVNKEYMFRVIHAYYQEVIFIGDNEGEIINDLLIEFEKELV